MIEYIDINGVKHPFLFSIRAAREIDNAGKIGDIDTALLMGWLGLKYGYQADKKEIGFTQDEFESWVDLKPEILGDISKIVIEQSGKLGEKMGNLTAPKV